MSTDPAPRPHATAEEVEAARHDRKLANVLYHDWEAGSYDDKWSISYDERCITYAADRFRTAVDGHGAGDAAWPYERALELGSGTGFFLLNLMQAGLAEHGSVTDLSPGMVQAALRNAEHLGLDVDGRVADAEKIPYDDDTFDVVVGHAVLHHIPDLDTAFREILRVLKPGGRFVFAGEPTKIGDRYARKLGQLTWKAATTVTRLPALAGWRRPQAELDESSRAAALEAVVDIHVFDPAELDRIARAAGASDVRVVTEEFTAAMLGWPVRTFEAAVPPGKLGMRWALFAYHGWQRLSWLDRCVLSRVVPRAWFYNALITGTKRPESH
ncbi:class I SAM-dependent methyltransferase [Pseudonocardia sp.]|uniref:class I SAM-dependent methyltransferase n=1 Tax=Pseudonocardia sp. TaxID=60912 RepID=UPI00260C742E|nr:class I SAM-dependent methyltransferase [Pseudonocardia sp.]MCW2720147.1 Methyltransferase type 11 [Pseudonocardia sp.]